LFGVFVRFSRRFQSVAYCYGNPLERMQAFDHLLSLTKELFGRDFLEKLTQKYPKEKLNTLHLQSQLCTRKLYDG
jgi:hypothetical protein